MAFSLLLADIKAIIVEARSAAYAGINAVQIDQNWKIGRRIVEEEQGGKTRAEYGKRTISELSAHLCAEFGEGYSERNLWEFRRFYATFPDIEILHTRVQNLSWSHFRLIMRVADPVAREWYINEASNEHWGVRTLDRNISCQTESNIDDAVLRERRSEMRDLCQQYRSSKMGAEVIPGLLESLRKATSWTSGRFANSTTTRRSSSPSIGPSSARMRSLCWNRMKASSTSRKTCGGPCDGNSQGFRMEKAAGKKQIGRRPEIWYHRLQKEFQNARRREPDCRLSAG